MVDEKKNINQIEEMYENPFDDKKLLDLDNDGFENEVNNLIEWCEDLDYEKYMNNWHALATSAYVGLDKTGGSPKAGTHPALYSNNGMGRPDDLAGMDLDNESYPF